MERHRSGRTLAGVADVGRCRPGHPEPQVVVDGVGLHVAFQRHPVAVGRIVGERIQPGAGRLVCGEYQKFVERAVRVNHLFPPITEDVSYERGVPG